MNKYKYFLSDFLIGIEFIQELTFILALYTLETWSCYSSQNIAILLE